MWALYLCAIFVLPPLQQDEGPREPPDLRCGAYCTYSVIKALDVTVPSFEEFEKQLGQPSIHGYSLQQLCDIADQFGASARSIESDPESLYKVPRPFGCVALLKSGHFVGVYDVNSDDVFLIDPPESYQMRKGLFEELWTGNALLIFPAEAPDLTRSSPLPWVRVAGTLGTVGIVLVAAFVVFRKFRVPRSPRYK